MKNIFAIILLMTLFNYGVTAQTKIAVKGGFNYSTGRVYYGTEKQPTGYKLGGNIGLQADVPFDEGLHFIPTLSYNTRGFTTSPIKGDTSEIDNTIHYIDMTPRLGYYLTPDKDASFVIGVGMSLNVAIGGKEKITAKGVTSEKKMDFNVTGGYGPYDFGFVPSIGYYTKKFFIEGVYQLGLTSINNEEEFDKRNIRNRTLSLNFGYFFK